MTFANSTIFTGHLKPTRETAQSVTLEWANQYAAALREASHLEDFDQYVRKLSVKLHATVTERHFSDVLDAVMEVHEVQNDEHEDLRVNQLGTINNKTDLLDAKLQELHAAINHLLDYAGFGLSPRSVAA